MIILGTNSIKDTGFDVANSCNFEDGSLHKSVSSPSATFTISVWVKLSNQYVATSSIGQRYFWTGGGAGGASGAKWNDGNVGILDFYNEGTGHVNDGTGRNYRDPSSWYHWVWKNSSGTGTLYVNGVQQGSTFSMGPLIGSGGPDVINIGRYGADTVYAPMTLAEFVYLDGTAATPTSFGEVDDDSGIWKPIDVSGLTFGTNGFHLDFQTAGTLGNDANGGTDLTKTGTLVQHTDTPTNNFATMNALDNYPISTPGTFSKGNLQIVSGQGSSSSNGYSYFTGTFGLSTGKWYWEAKCTNTGAASLIGIVGKPSDTPSSSLNNNTYGYTYRHSDGKIYNNGSGASYGNTYGTSDIIGIALDLDNNKLYFSKNGTFQNSGDPTSGATGTGAKSITAAASTNTGFYFPVVGDTDYAGTSTWQLNFGGGSPISVSSGNTDGDGFGNFEYAPPSGYFALCTKNLSEYG